MKLMIVAPFDSKGRYKGGISSIVNALFDSGELQKKNVDVLKFDTCQIIRSNATESKLNLQNLTNAFLVLTKLRKEIKKEKPDIVYFHTSIGVALLKDCLIIKYVKKHWPNIKIVQHIHFAEYNKIMPSKEAFKQMTLFILKKYPDMIVFLSEKTKEEFINNGINKNKATVIYNFSTISFNKDCLKKSKDGVLKFLFVGAIGQRKGIYDVLSAFKAVQGEYEFHICGDFISDEAKKEFFIAISGIEDKIIFHGYISAEEKRSVYQKSDILVLPSYGEGLPVVILEGYSAGCAIIASNVGAIPEIVSTKNGIIVEPGDINKLASTIQYYLDGGRHYLSKQQMINYKEAEKYTIDEFAKSVFDVCCK